MTGWFSVQRLRDAVYLVGEPMHVNNYLVVGSKRAVLFDTGLGVADIRRCAEQLTDRPLLVVNSHHHFDHVGGNALFDDIAIHTSGAPLLAELIPDGLLRSYAEFAAGFYQEYLSFREIDDATVGALAPEMRMRPWPPDGLDPGAWRIAPRIPTRLLADGDDIDLGDRVLHVVHTPGHSPDSICLVDRAERLLLAGDTIYAGQLYAQFDTSDVTAYARSAARLVRDWTGSVDAVLGAHGSRYLVYPDLVARVADGLARVVADDPGIEYRPVVDILGTAAREARFADFSVVIPFSPGSPSG